MTLGTAKAMLSLNLKGYERVTISEKETFENFRMSEFLRLMNELPNDVKEKIIKLTEEQEKKVK